MYKCSSCQSTFSRRKDARRHVQRHNPDIFIINFDKPNDRYMSPGTATLPAARPQPKSDPKLTPREQAAEHRRQLKYVPTLKWPHGAPGGPLKFRGTIL